MNINAGRNTVNLSLSKDKERPSFATVFDKLNARKLNRKNPLNAVLTQEQMFRYYLEETEPKLGEMPDNFDLEDTIGGQSLADMKLRDFAKLLSGDFEGNKATPVYETLSAGVSYPSMLAPLIAPAPPPPPPPPPARVPPSGVPSGAPSGAPSAPVAPVSAPVAPVSAPVIPAPSSSIATYIAPPVAVSGLMPTGTGSAPASAPVSAPVSALSGGGGGGAPAPPASGAVAGAGAATPPSAAGGATPTTSPTIGATLSTPLRAPPITTAPATPSSIAAAAALSALSHSSPSSIAVPTPSVITRNTSSAAAALLTLASGSPAAASSPAGSGADPFSPAAAGARTPVSFVLDRGGYRKDSDDLKVYQEGIREGLLPPRRPSDLSKAVNIQDERWIEYTIEILKYNKMATVPFTLSDKQKQIQKNYETALATGIAEGDIDAIIQNTKIIGGSPFSGAKSKKKK